MEGREEVDCWLCDDGRCERQPAIVQTPAEEAEEDGGTSRLRYPIPNEEHFALHLFAKQH
jgi:hypothetical protein